MKYFVLVTLTLFNIGQADVSKAAKQVGTYTFPSDKTLEKYAKWPLRVNSLVNGTKDFSVTYLLPNNVTGTRTIEIKMSGTKTADPFFKISGVKGEGTCIDSLRHITCIVKFRDLGIDSNEVSRFLAKNLSNKKERDNRQTVATAYSNEPIGLLMIEK